MCFPHICNDVECIMLETKVIWLPHGVMGTFSALASQSITTVSKSLCLVLLLTLPVRASWMLPDSRFQKKKMWSWSSKEANLTECKQTAWNCEEFAETPRATQSADTESESKNLQEILGRGQQGRTLLDVSCLIKSLRGFLYEKEIVPVSGNLDVWI